LDFWSQGHARYPDFKHKRTQEALWLNNNLKPPWVESKLVAMAPGSVQVSIFQRNIQLARYAKAGHYEMVLKLFQQLQQEEVTIPDRFTFVPVLNACASLRALAEGRHIHAQIVQSGFESDVYIGNSLVDMYAKCGSMEDSWRVFSRMPTRDSVAWNALISGYVKCGQGHKALALAQEMQQEGLEPGAVTFVAVLNACASVLALEEGRRVHEHVIRSGLESNLFVGNSLVDMYVKCKSLEEAWRVFNRMPTRNVVSWNAMILGHVKCGYGRKALEVSQQMQQEGVEPNTLTFVGALNACASLAALEEGRHLHQQIIQSGCESDVLVGNSLVDMYAKCGSIEDAWRVFSRMQAHDVFAWSAIILGYVKCGQGKKALELVQQMQLEGVKPDPGIFVAVLNACASVMALAEGKLIHSQIIQNGCESDIFVGSSLVDMYSKCGCISDAWKVFNRMSSRNVVAWNAMILGFVKSGQGQKSLELFRQMEQKGVEPDPVTFVGVLNACASVSALEEGRHIHQQIIQSGLESAVFVGSSLLDMYAKCGSIEDAQKVFNKMPMHDVVTWTAMLKGYAMHGLGKEALRHFEQMSQAGVEMDQVTFISLLSACTHAGLVDEGLCYFESMGSVYGVPATVEHYACIVDLLGRAGHLQEAEDFISTMSCEPAVSVLVALLGACRIHHNVEMGERIARQLVELDPGNVASYVLLSNIYAAAGKWDLSASVQQQRLEKGRKKQPGPTWIEVNNEIHTFVVDDQDHPQMVEIHA
jgi:pentatricopeptide repeat protein